MSQDSSSSSSEDEEQSAVPPEPTESRPSRFQCPPDFVPCSYKPCRATKNISSDSEIWLIKAPSTFNPQSFSGVKLSLQGVERVSVPSGDGTEQAYNVLSSPTPCPELRLMVPPGNLGPSVCGVINISETNVDPDSNRALHVVPAIPPPSIPAGLKQRFQYFQAPTVTTHQTEEEEEEEAPRKKKKKKEKKIKSEPQETVTAAQSEVVIKTEVKEEPMDTGFGDQPEVHKKKKKKKKSKSAEESL